MYGGKGKTVTQITGGREIHKAKVGSVSHSGFPQYNRGQVFTWRRLHRSSCLQLYMPVMKTDLEIKLYSSKPSFFGGLADLPQSEALISCNSRTLV